VTRNWGIPAQEGGFRKARGAKPVLTLGVTAIYGVIGAGIAGLAFSDARGLFDGLFRGWSLIPAVVAAGFGCWLYILMAWKRFAAQFTGGDAFSDLLRFYCRAAIALIVFQLAARFAELILGPAVSGLLLCISAGAGCAAAFQTVMTFVPAGKVEQTPTS
jgi:hypothetical protein